MTKTTVKARTQVNRKLAAIGTVYHESLPVQAISSILDEHGFESEELSGIYCGREGRVHAQVSPRHYIYFSWYKMPSGRFEVTSYVN